MKDYQKQILRKEMKQIELLDGSLWDQDELVKLAEGDEFYYGTLGKYALSSSNIKKILDSPKTYYNLMQYGEETNSQALRDGRLIHMMCLEPHRIDELVFADVSTKTTKKWKEMSAEYPNHVLYTVKERQKAERIADAIFKNEQARELLSDSRFEVPAVDYIEGVPFRAKADILKNKGGIVDLKTTSDLRNFVYSSRHKYSYDVQVFIYCQLFNIDYSDFKFLVIDKASCDIGVYTCSAEFYNKGEAKTLYAIAQYNEFFDGKSKEEVQEMLHDYTITGEL
jgi:hypothetical protein